jgi:hypothetical protein
MLSGRMVTTLQNTNLKYMKATEYNINFYQNHYNWNYLTLSFSPANHTGLGIIPTRNIVHLPITQGLRHYKPTQHEN